MYKPHYYNTTLAGGWAGVTEYGLNFVLLIKGKSAQIPAFFEK
jgi:hypothetical protein